MIQTKQTEEETSVRIAVFFDGTGNNKTNSSNDPLKYGAITNIAKLYDACQIQERLYVEGVGTVDNKEDSIWAKATGNNPIGYTGYSYSNKLEKGLEYLRKKRSDFPKAILELYVYGFSRGATLARDFAKRALANGRVNIKFLGIFDTVVSLLTERPFIHFDENELRKVDQLIHLCAIQECRRYFPLTSIEFKRNSNELIHIENYYTATVKEVFVPGAHADLGGGYLLAPENVYLNEIRSSCDSLYDDLLLVKNTQRDNFSCRDNQSIWTSLLGNNVSCKALWLGNNLVSERIQVKIEINQVYFELMASYTNTYFRTDVFVFNNGIEIPSLLQLKDDIQNYLIGNVPQKGPCYDYYTKYADFTHISANFGETNSTSTNNQLNTFDFGLLAEEIKKMKEGNPTADWSSYTVNLVADAFDLNPLYVNQPNNSKWQRKVIYG